ncbi:MAG: hypothetical protein QOH29_2341 [Actinomycetota bacterium]|jgi:hypothetical protein|nr:hypothetical protein [Actinomycetota bacterium]
MWNIHEGVDAPLTPARIKDLNKRLLAGQPIGDDVHPGEVRTHSVTVMNYRGARAEDCDCLLSRLCNLADPGLRNNGPRVQVLRRR